MSFGSIEIGGQMQVYVIQTDFSRIVHARRRATIDLAVLCLAFLPLLCCCKEPTFKISMFGEQVEVSKDDVPEDYGDISVAMDFKRSESELWSGGAPKAKAVSAEEEAVVQIEHLKSLDSDIQGATAGSVRRLLVDLHELHILTKERNELLIEWVLKAYAKAYEAAYSEEMAKVEGLKADYQYRLAKEKDETADAKGEGIVVGGIGAWLACTFASFGIAAGPCLIVGAAAGYAAGASTEDHVPEPELPTEADIIRKASQKAGLGKDPKQGLKSLGVKLHAELLAADIQTSETMLSAYEVLLRRVLFDAEEGIRLAETASTVLEDATKNYEAAKQTWDESNEKYKASEDLYLRAAENYENTVDALMLSIIVMGIAEAFTEYTSMSTSEYRQHLKSKGVDLKGKDIDHIVSKGRGGADHPWNYQAVQSGLNRSWQDGALFEKCLGNPIGCLKGITVSYPGLPGGGAGVGYYEYKKHGGEKKD